MGRTLLVLALASPLAAAAAASEPAYSVDALYEQGQQRLPSHWRPLGKTADAAVFVHTGKKKTPHGYFAVWRSRELAAPGYINKEFAYLSVRERVLVDCAEDRIGVTARSHLAGRFGSGPVGAQSESASPEWSYALPDSLDEQLLRNLCAPSPKKPRKATKS